jgi:predicted chitinase
MQKFKAHAQALCFWEQAKQAGYLDIDANHWHIDPRVFIKQFRKCGWLSESELTQTLPMSALRQSRGQWVSEPINLTQARTRNIQRTRIELNRSLRKFNIAPSPLRMAAFIANALVETQWFETLHENNRAAWYYPWDGRGFLQLTGPDNYIKYWRFLGRTVPESLEKELSTAASKAHTEQKNDALKDAKHPDLTALMIQWRDDVETKAKNATDSAGAYWAWTGAAKFADLFPAWQRMTHYADNDKTTNVYYRSDSFGQVAATVNFGSPVHDLSAIAKVNGIVARRQAYTHAVATLGEGLGFFDANGQSQEMPDGYERRKS